MTAQGYHLGVPCGRRPEPVVRLRPDELRPGELGTIFRSGAKAVILVEDERVSELWRALVTSDSRFAEMDPGEGSPWEAPVCDIARNHQLGDRELGDMLRFVPGQIGYIARKFMVVPLGEGAFQTVPGLFWNQSQSTTIPQRVQKLAWVLVSDIFKSTLPEGGRRPPSYAVSIERLKYPSSAREYEAISTLLRNSGGSWSRLAHRIDAGKALAIGPFDKRLIRDLYSASSLVPVLGSALVKLSQWIQDLPRHRVPSGAIVIGRPHVDQTKMVTALAGDRDILTTQVDLGNRWIDIPLSPHSLAIFPSGLLDASLRISPTRHRVLMAKAHHAAALRPNVTLSLAVASRPPETSSEEPLQPERELETATARGLAE